MRKNCIDVIFLSLRAKQHAKKFMMLNTVVTRNSRTEMSKYSGLYITNHRQSFTIILVQMQMFVRLSR